MPNFVTFLSKMYINRSTNNHQLTKEV